MSTSRFCALSLMVCGLVPSGAGAAPRDRSESFSITIPTPYDQALEVVREVSSDAVIHGAAQYDAESTIDGADTADSSPDFPQWKGPGAVLFKVRPKTIAPSNFKGSRDIGTVTLRYIVERIGPNETRLTIDAVFVEDNRHGRHPSQGLVEVAEFAEIAQRLKHSDAADGRQQVQAKAAPKN